MANRKDVPTRDRKAEPLGSTPEEFMVAAINQVAAGTQEGEEVQVLEGWDLQSVTFPKANQRGPELTITSPANGQATVKGRALLEQICETSRLGTHRPTAFLVSINHDKSMLWLLPVVGSHSSSAIPISYDRTGFRINLYKPFRLLSRLVQEGYRETYTLWTTPTRVKIDDATGHALFIELNHYTRQQVHRMTDEQRSARDARRAARQASVAEPTPSST